MSCNQSDDLKAFWDQKLKDSGFIDIEEQDSWQHHCAYFFSRYHPDVFYAKREYFMMAEQFLNSYSFESNKEEEIWKRHASGVYPVQISKEIKLLGHKANKDTIYKIIKKLEEKMKAWVSK